MTSLNNKPWHSANRRTPLDPIWEWQKVYAAQTAYLNSKQMSAASFCVYRTNFRDTAQKGVTLMSVNIEFGDR